MLTQLDTVQRVGPGPVGPSASGCGPSPWRHAMLRLSQQISHCRDDNSITQGSIVTGGYRKEMEPWQPRQVIKLSSPSGAALVSYSCLVLTLDSLAGTGELAACTALWTQCCLSGASCQLGSRTKSPTQKRVQTGRCHQPPITGMRV